MIVNNYEDLGIYTVYKYYLPLQTQLPDAFECICLLTETIISCGHGKFQINEMLYTY